MNVYDNFMPPGFPQRLLARALIAQNWQRVDGDYQRHYEINPVPEWPEVAEFRRALAAELPMVRFVLDVRDFTHARTEMKLTVRDNGGVFNWHADHTADGNPETRVLTFCYYLRPGDFDGGALEFTTGEAFEPIDNRLVLFDSYRVHRVTPVRNCAGGWEHGRWALVGWLHCSPGEVVEPALTLDPETVHPAVVKALDEMHAWSMLTGRCEKCGVYKDDVEDDIVSRTCTSSTPTPYG